MRLSRRRSTISTTLAARKIGDEFVALPKLATIARMKFTPFRAALAAVAVFVAVSFLGGSAMWSVLGLAEDLTIDGSATVVRQDTGEIGDDWIAYGGDAGGNRYFAAGQINRDNVTNLAIAWTHKSAALDGRSEGALRRAALQTTPILVEGSLVYCTQFNQVIALDPGTGEEKWRYDPEVPTDSNPGNQYTCRGVSYWQDSASEADTACASRLFMGTVDARIIALDTRSGQLCEEFGEERRRQNSTVGFAPLAG